MPNPTVQRTGANRSGWLRSLTFSLAVSRVTSNMKILHILIGLAGCCLWGGCAHDQAQVTSKNPAKPGNAAPIGQTATFRVVGTTNGGPLTYQWYSSGTNITGATNR